ncbi:GntR family transcriptional regulator [Comamonas endophytica]|uniref:GntR family transcriptional regulator n=1 Tax=Comamonas endophytica TaxID=2949090 RepID=A0ABY6G8F4_9BURK|nr:MULTISPECIES: GntR family transcriptional regulator [unclassified Acidovorax]MCD2514170.1 GntR family transcriptional regulator [Acidovorax sp. D4N7]UYG51309.1 GntR family transcriptional regulator [Acidovorax sp. 5MLIR]
MKKETSQAAEPVAITEQVLYQSIECALLEGRLPAGTPLRERHLAESFEVTRGMVRKVLIRLGQDGKLDVQPNRGAFVPTPTPAQVVDAYQARVALECGALMELSARITPAQLQQLQEMVRHEHSAAASGQARQHSVRMAGNFHTAVVEILGSPTLLAMCRQLIARTQMYVALYEPQSASECAPQEHAQVLQALEKRDAQGAAQAMKAHLLLVQNRVLQRMQPRPCAPVADILKSIIQGH